ncbi:hypothetical protein [Deefgea sp. CFH1-16]|jgi:predicted membrane protein|uniref:hypothetical protein n=1 Tax=Deefgea sp. CFH1-16 TaxID=2675457 RepID=UPI0015F6E2F5|nr:hypothetical protein [Deefgea sp. CFH1-16]MBM5573651.1 hypothetical protein [Deefgea sp. CFH1-16]
MSTFEIVALVVPMFIIGYLVFFPSWLKEATEKILTVAMGLSMDSIKFTETIVEITMIMAHFLGRIATTLLLIGALAVFFNETLPIFGLGTQFIWSEYNLLRELFTKPYTWAAATTIITSTVAIGHLRKLDIDRQEREEKQIEKIESKIKERMEKNKIPSCKNRPLF